MANPTDHGDADDIARAFGIDPDEVDTDDVDIDVEIDHGVDFDGETDHINDDLLDAVTQAFTESIGHLIDQNAHWVRPSDDDHDRILGRFSVKYPELPVADGPEMGFAPPYRAREEFEAELRKTLPDGVTFERKNKHMTTLYAEIGGDYQ